MKARPIQAAFASAGSFAEGAFVLLIAAGMAPIENLAVVVGISVRFGPFLACDRLIASTAHGPAALFDVSVLSEQAFYEDELLNGPVYGLDDVFGSIAEVV